VQAKRHVAPQVLEVRTEGPLLAVRMMVVGMKAEHLGEKEEELQVGSNQGEVNQEAMRIQAVEA
jgi:hypothetical protein